MGVLGDLANKTNDGKNPITNIQEKMIVDYANCCLESVGPNDLDYIIEGEEWKLFLRLKEEERKEVRIFLATIPNKESKNFYDLKKNVEGCIKAQQNKSDMEQSEKESKIKTYKSLINTVIQRSHGRITPEGEKIIENKRAIEETFVVKRTEFSEVERKQKREQQRSLFEDPENYKQYIGLKEQDLINTIANKTEEIYQNKTPKQEILYVLRPVTKGVPDIAIELGEKIVNQYVLSKDKNIHKKLQKVIPEAQEYLELRRNYQSKSKESDFDLRSTKLINYLNEKELSVEGKKEVDKLLQGLPSYQKSQENEQENELPKELEQERA